MLKPFYQLNNSDILTVGGKGASLGELSKIDGVNVPNGFVITADIFKEHLQLNQLDKFIAEICSTTDFNNTSECDNTSKTIREKIESTYFDISLKNDITNLFKSLNLNLVAVRSSATVEDSPENSWAGQLDTVLSVPQQNLFDSIIKCWSSLYTARALFYRNEKGLIEKDIYVAVVVQQMVDSEISGTAFSINPTNEDFSEIIIDAGYGLGEYIVSGKISPETYKYDKINGISSIMNDLEQSVGLFQNFEGGTSEQLIENKGKILNNEQLKELCHLILKIENHYGFPCDIEWAFSKCKFYILQSRPITTISQLSKNIRNFYFEQEDYVPVGRWSQPPFTCSFFVKWTTAKVIQELINDSKFHPLCYLDGYAFVRKKDLDFLTDFLIDEYKNRRLKDFAIRLDSLGNKLHKKHKKFLSVKQPTTKSLLKMLESHQEYQSFWNFEAICGDLIILDVAKTVGLIKEDIELFNEVIPRSFKNWIEIEDFEIVKIAKNILKNKSYNIDKAIERHQRKYQWLGTDRWEGKSITSDEIQKRVEDAIDNLKAENYVHVEKKQLDLENDDPLVSLGVITSYWRATCGGLSCQIEYKYRPLLQQLASSIGVSYKDLIHLTVDELIKTIKSPTHKIFTAKLLEREKEFFICLGVENTIQIAVPSDVPYHSLKNKMLKETKEVTHSNNELKGIGASSGFVAGKVRIVFSKKDFDSFKDGEILVSPETTPAFVPLMRMASAIITDRGGITSHAAIVSRELKKPCIIAVKNASNILKNGDFVEVNASTGILTILEKAL